MNMLNIVRLVFATVFDCYYVMHTTYVFGTTPIDTVMFYFFLVSIVLLFVRRLVL